MAKGIDCANPLTAKTAKSLAKSGFEFAGRYLVPAAYKWKRLTDAEAKVITDAGMQIVSVFETTASRPSGGASAGKLDGASAYKEAIGIGQTTGSAIYFAVDYDAQPGDYGHIEAYLKAAKAELPGYEVGVYGSYAVIEEMAKRKACGHFWQTYAWSGGKKSGHANIYQYKIDTTVNGLAVDLNESFGGEGWWSLNGEEESVMSEKDANKIIAFLQAGFNATESKEARDEFHRLANEVRKAAGMPPA
ncbi:DUF1906 domain-containing protein [Cohnella faecalis]|uniref:DUF1906 domain-containing protein n=1 Tax=Cohnella faecalis TaxID=2315694 RepID=A0A398CS59_9BACL|nr:DUF1906 domain-containing protein [Cohnella faecalis]RIE02211.1 DUF1906 domain-containing protein [Cohnella faecalis]